MITQKIPLSARSNKSEIMNGRSNLITDQTASTSRLKKHKSANRLRKIVYPDEKSNISQARTSDAATLTPSYLRPSDIPSHEQVSDTKGSRINSSPNRSPSAREISSEESALILKSLLVKEKERKMEKFSDPRRAKLTKLGALHKSHSVQNIKAPIPKEKEPIIHEGRVMGLRDKKSMIDSLNPQKQKLKIFLKALRVAVSQMKLEESSRLEQEN
jgi:hypothetical protein